VKNPTCEIGLLAFADTLKTFAKQDADPDGFHTILVSHEQKILIQKQAAIVAELLACNADSSHTFYGSLAPEHAALLAGKKVRV
jgi:hypothetical protein